MSRIKTQTIMKFGLAGIAVMCVVEACISTKKAEGAPSVNLEVAQVHYTKPDTIIKKDSPAPTPTGLRLLAGQEQLQHSQDKVTDNTQLIIQLQKYTKSVLDKLDKNQKGQDDGRKESAVAISRLSTIVISQNKDLVRYQQKEQVQKAEDKQEQEAKDVSAARIKTIQFILLGLILLAVIVKTKYTHKTFNRPVAAHL